MFTSSYNPFSSFSIDTTSLSFKNYADYKKKPVNPFCEYEELDFAAELDKLDQDYKFNNLLPGVYRPSIYRTAEEIRIAEEFEQVLKGDTMPNNNYTFKKSK